MRISSCASIEVDSSVISEIRIYPPLEPSCEAIKKVCKVVLEEQNARAPLVRAIRECADTRLRGRAHVDRVTDLSPFVKFLSIFRGHAHAPAGGNG